MILYQQGEYRAFETLYDRYASRIFGYLKTKLYGPGEAEDLLQSVFLKLHSSRLRYDASFPFLPWIFTLARHTLVDHLRKHRAIPMEIEAVERISDESQQGVSISEHEKPNWDEILKILPREQKELIKLRFEADLSFDEIAKRSGISEVSARKRFSRVIQGLRKIVVGEKKG